MIQQSGDEIKKAILDLTRRYVESEKKPEFIAGKSWIHYAGRVFDSEEYTNLVEASLDGWITSGRFSEQFQLELSSYLNSYSSLIVNSGSSANLLAISALTSPSLGKNRLRKGDEVLTIAATFPTTVNPIIQNGLIPVFSDIELGSYNVNVDELEDAISEKTKAIFFAHTLGNPFDVDKVLKLAKTHNLYLIEDNCDALGSEFNGQKTGTFGSLSTVSFYPAHHITMGEGGAVVMQDPELDVVVRSFRDWGRDCYCEPGASDTCGMRFNQQFGSLPLGYDHKYVYSHIGYNLKATDLQAAIGLAQIKKLPKFVEARRNNFKYIYDALKEYENLLILPKWNQKSNPAWFGFPITIHKSAAFKRSELVAFLEGRKIMTRMIFAGNLLRHPAYSNIDYRLGTKLTNTDFVMNNSFFVGVYPGIDVSQLNYIIDSFRLFLKRYK